MANKNSGRVKKTQRIAILGGGPSALLMFKRLVDLLDTNIVIDVFEKKKILGAGMPYSAEGANDEHVTNVSGNEIPELVTSLANWIKTVPKDTLNKYRINANHFNEFKVLPRLLFGQYLTAQFQLLQKMAKEAGVDFSIHYNSLVTNVTDHPEREEVTVQINGEQNFTFDQVIICTGHNWPIKKEGIIPNYFDSPYPPVKLALRLNHPVAIKGSSLTAVDAIRTLSRYNGKFNEDKNGQLCYHLADSSTHFKIIMHTRNGMLPAVRFHLEDPHLSNDSLLTREEIAAHIAANDGFLSLDYIFDNDFKAIFKDKDPEFYEQIKDMYVEDFVAAMMDIRERLDPFQLLKAEYQEAEQSIKRKESIYWKETLGVLSFALNYPAKHLSAEDMQRLQHTLIPLISIVIAYIPQSSSKELLALHQAGVLELISVGDDSKVEAKPEGGAIYYYTDDQGQNHTDYYHTYIDCVGQPHLAFEDFPFKGLIDGGAICPAKLKFRSADAGRKAFTDGKPVTQDIDGDFYLKVSGIAINDHFQVVNQYGAFNNRIYNMAVPYIGGYNPDYSGLDFSEEASSAIVKKISPVNEFTTAN